MTFLTPVRRVIELLMVAYGGGFGLFVWWAYVGGAHALGWANISPDHGFMVGKIMLFAALIHAMGIRINGHWRGSPFLRLAGVVAHMIMITTLAVWGIEVVNTAAFTYGFIVTMFAAVTWFVLEDCAAALGARASWSR